MMIFLIVLIFFLMICRHPRSTRTNPPFPYTTLFRSGGDSGERIEIVATDGESLAGYRVHLYSGGSSPGSANTYGSATVPTGSVSSCGGSVRIATVAYSGLQNGSNDAIALVDAGGAVVQFLRSEERRVGKECVSTCRSRWSLEL